MNISNALNTQRIMYLKCVLQILFVDYIPTLAEVLKQMGI